MPFAKEADTKVNDILEADGGFTCIPEGHPCLVKEDDNGLYVACAGEDLDEQPCQPGLSMADKHYLDGQLNEHAEYVGLTKIGRYDGKRFVHINAGHNPDLIELAHQIP